jgi:predicted transcriptional regulator
MPISPASSSSFSSPILTSPTYEKPKNLFPLQSQTRLNATIEAESLSVQKYAFDYTSKDGDRVTLSMESVQYQKTTMNISAEGSPEEMQNISDYVTQQYAAMKDELIKAMKDSLGLVTDEETGKVTLGSDELKIPDYWSAENTSQRIVDFAISFYNAFKGQGSEFLQMIKDAIEEGFKQAKDILGNLPDNVNNLVQDTHDLTMKKLDEWAQKNGIIVDNLAPDYSTGASELKAAA